MADEEYEGPGVYVLEDEDGTEDLVYVDEHGNAHEIDEDDLEGFEDDGDAGWHDKFVRNLEQLDRKLDRCLTERELSAIAERLEDAEYPDVQAAYDDHYKESGEKEHDLSSPAGRKAYMAERYADDAAAEAE